MSIEGEASAIELGKETEGRKASRRARRVSRKEIGLIYIGKPKTNAERRSSQGSRLWALGLERIKSKPTVYSVYVKSDGPK